MTTRRLGLSLTEVLAKHGPMNDAGAGAPPADAMGAATPTAAVSATTTPAPASQLLDRDLVTQVLFAHYYDASWSTKRQGFRCVCHWIGEDHAGHVADELVTALTAVAA